MDTLDRIRAGDENALRVLLDREWPGLVRFLTRRLDSPDTAQDASQEAFVRLWEQRERWEAGSARALLYRIGVNVAEDLRRRAAVRRRDLSSVTARPPAPATPAEELEDAETRALVGAALEDLPPRRREVFELVRNRGLSYGEAAEALELSHQTVANHMSLALRDLRTALAPVVGRGAPAVPPPTDDARSRDG